MTALYIILAAVAYVAACFIIYSLMRVSSDADDRADREYVDFTYTGHFCSDCRHHLGGGQCRLNAELECAEGGGFELWEGKDA